MIVTFLGTGTSQGIPVVACDCNICRSIDFRDKRTRTSVHIESDGNSFVVDTGPDFRQQMLRERIVHLDAVIYTHQHKDHTAGLDDIRGFNFRQKGSIPVYADAAVLDQLKREYSYIFEDHKYPGIPSVEINQIENKEFAIKGTDFLPIKVLHYQLPVYGFRIKDFTYITDANFIEDKEMDKIKGSRILVLNALRQKPHISHFTLEEAVAVIKEINPEKAYLTHISHQMGTHKDASLQLPENIELAYDGLKVELE